FAAERRRIGEHRLGPLSRPDLDLLISGPGLGLVDPYARAAVLDLAEGSPLIARAAATLAAEGEDIRGLSADAALRRRFDELITEALGGDAQDAIHLLAILAGLGGIETGELKLRDAIRSRLHMDAAREQQIINDLARAGILRKGYGGLRIVPDVLADHLLCRWFCDPAARRYDFRNEILVPYLHFGPAAIVRNLAEAEHRGESEASTLLTQLLDDLATQAAGASGGLQFAILGAVGTAAARRPEDAIYIVQKIINASDVPDAEAHDADLEAITVERWHVMHQTLEVLAVTRFALPGESLACLHRLAHWGSHDDRGARFV